MAAKSSRKKVHRFIGGFSVDGKRATVTDPALAHQIRDVLRLETGEDVILVEDGGSEYLCRISAVGPAAVRADVLETARGGAGTPARVILYCSVIKKENFELVVQKATEVGVSEIVPVISRRTVKLNVRGDRLHKIAKEAAEQSGRTEVPEIREPLSLERAMDKAAAAGHAVFFDVSGDRAFTTTGPDKGADLGIFIGPEGGWDDTEIAAARKRGFAAASLGGLVLRAETAAIIASYLACRQAVEEPAKPW